MLASVALFFRHLHRFWKYVVYRALGILCRVGMGFVTCCVCRLFGVLVVSWFYGCHGVAVGGGMRGRRCLVGVSALAVGWRCLVWRVGLGAVAWDDLGCCLVWMVCLGFAGLVCVMAFRGDVTGLG